MDDPVEPKKPAQGLDGDPHATKPAAAASLRRKRRAKAPATKTTTPEASQSPGLVSEPMRLNVYLQRRGVASRRKADELIQAGLVRVNRKVVTTLGSKVKPGDSVSVGGRVIRTEVPTVTYLFNKPDLTLTTRKDGRSRRTIYDLPALAKLPQNVQPVGRLDFRSEGLLILTNDGDLALSMSHPKYHVEKTYAVLVSEQFATVDLERLRNGVDLADGFAKPLAVKVGGTENLGGSRGQWIKIVVAEGRHRLVRRMLAAIGFKVVRLVRIGIGSIQLPDNLASGQIMPPSEPVRRILEEYRQRAKDAPLRAEPPNPNKSSQPETQEDFKPRKKRQSRIESLLAKSRASRKKRRDAAVYSVRKQAESMELAKQKRHRKERLAEGRSSANETKS
jgi:23S rRNA pseudouridine2605 synthase